MKKLLILVAFGFISLQALNLDEMMHQEYDIITFDCTETRDINNPNLCIFSGAINEYEDKVTMIMGNFYTSYHKILIQHINAQDKLKIDDMVKNLFDVEKECKESAYADNEPFPGDPPVTPAMQSFGYTDCMQYYGYLKSFKQLIDFTYENPQYKYIFDSIFAPNPKEYYELIKSSDDFREIIDKAARDGLIDNVGRLIEK